MGSVSFSTSVLMLSSILVRFKCVCSSCCSIINFGASSSVLIRKRRRVSKVTTVYEIRVSKINRFNNFRGRGMVYLVVACCNTSESEV
jgi:hypothetical protein